MRYLYKLLFFCSIISIHYTYGQSTTRTHSNFFLTPEIGATFSDADVSTRTSVGVGLKLGYTFAKYRLVEFDLRARYFGGSWKGQNKRNSDLSDYTTGIYSALGTDYKNSLGYTVRNFKTTNHNLSFEGLIRFNIEPTRTFAPYIFGGIATSSYNTKSNLVDENGSIYQYDAEYLPTFKSDYDKIHDKTYESFVDGRDFKNSLTGNIGIGFSYNITDGVRFGLEHTMSFTQIDDFDGYIADKAFTKNDVYHFTSFYIQFYLRGKKHKKDKPVKPTNNQVNNTTPPCTPPQVTIQRPSRQGETVEDGRYSFVATVSGVTNQNDITLTINGRQVNDFSFNASNGRVSTLQSLNYGTNNITISARNSCGNNSQTSSVIYQRTNPEPPIVYFTNPSANPYTATNNRFNLTAKALHVNGKENVTFRQNGAVNNNFTFNSSTKDFTSYVVLQNGSNVFEITGTNQDGVATASTVIIYGRTVDCQNPIISLRQPNRSPAYSNESMYTVVSNVFNVDRKDQITVTANNQRVTAFTFNAKERIVSAPIVLQRGTNTITIKATNNCGTSTETATVIYTPAQEAPAYPPTVSFTTPYQSNTIAKSSNYTFYARATNITNPNQIKVSFNGNTVTGFFFNVKEQLISFPASLIEGNNMASVTVTNNDGSASTTTTILYRAVVDGPAVQFTDPGISPTTVNNNTYNVVAKTINVTAKNQISYYVNGNKTTLFTFNPSSGEVNYNAVLQEGSNNFKIAVQTNGGSAIDQTTLIYNKRSIIAVPTVKFTSPSSNVTVSKNSYNLVAQTTNIDRAEQISIFKNGSPISLFSFDAATQQIHFAYILNTGENNFTVKVANESGTAQDDVAITYNMRTITLNPTVKWESPATSGTTSSAELYNFSAKTAFVNAKNNIAITLNGNNINDFNFNASNGTVAFKGKLNTGNNTAIIHVSNESGNGSDVTSVLYKAPVVECDKPIINLTNTTTKTVPSNYTLKGTVTNISNAQEIQIFINGTKNSSPVNYNPTNKSFSVALSLPSGSNVIEVKSSNKCGLTSAFTTLNVSVCYPPEIVLLSPIQKNPNTEGTTMRVEFGVTNLTAKEQIVLKVNNKTQTFSYDATNNRVTANVSNLVIGNNQVELLASNDCGSFKSNLTILRNDCKKPEITIANTSINNNGTTTNQHFSLNANVNYIDNNSQINVAHNNRPVNFVYNNVTNTLALDLNSQTGANTVVIKLTNSCGTTSYTHTYTRQEDPNAKPPVLTFTNPTSEITVESNTYSFALSTQYVTSKGQLAVKLNGQTVNFNFNESTKVITYTGSLKEGKNTTQVYAVTPYGSDEKAAVVNYRKQITVNPPVITISSHTCPVQLSPGVNTISGYVTNVESISAVKFYMDNAELGNVTTSISGNKVTFSYTIAARSTDMSQTLKITAQNSAKTEVKTCVIKYPSSNSGGTKSPDVTTPKTTTKPDIKINIPTKTTPKTTRDVKVVTPVETPKQTNDVNIKIETPVRVAPNVKQERTTPNSNIRINTPKVNTGGQRNSGGNTRVQP